MSTLLKQNEAASIFSMFAYAYEINFYDEFDVNSLKYKGLFEDTNRNENNIVRFSAPLDELTIDFVHSVLCSVRDTFGKGDNE